jgi:arylsulfatase A-like enzyme/Flp pilus assembly protein TadD
LLILGLGCNRVDVDPGWPRATGPNLLLVTIDTLRADHVGTYGAADALTPALDRLAAEGVRFETAIASSPLTLPSHASILTGGYPPTVGVRHNGVYLLEEEEETLAERLDAAGYDTGALVGSFVLARRFGLAQGFRFYDDEMSQKSAAITGYLERSAEVVTERAIAWLSTAQRPFFLWVHYYDPHFRYQAPPPFGERFADRPYDGEIAYVDFQLARLLERLRASGDLPQTVVVATSDHGESLGEHGEPTHSYTLYDAVLRVPLIMRGPGIPAGRTISGVVRSVDIAPTLLALLGLEPLSESDGISLQPVWSDAGGPPDIAYAETLATELELGWSPLYAIRTRRFHYVRAPRPELYDLASDSGQLVNLVETKPESAAAVAAELDEQVQTILAGAKQAAPVETDEQTLERLRALGYALTGDFDEKSGLDPKDGLQALRALWAANEAYDANQFERARKLVERAMERMPQSSRAHALLAFIYLHTGEAARALPHMQSAADLARRSAYYRAMVGEIHQELGNADAAQAAFHAAAALDPREPFAQTGLMGEQARRGNFVAAQRHARQALESDPFDVMVRVKIGKVWDSVGQHVWALEAFEDAVRVDPDSKYAHMQLAIALARLGRVQASQAHRERAGHLAVDPELASRLGLAYARSGRLEPAEAVLRDLLAAHPDHRPARRELVRVLRASGRAEEAADLEAASFEARDREADGGTS